MLTSKRLVVCWRREIRWQSSSARGGKYNSVQKGKSIDIKYQGAQEGEIERKLPRLAHGLERVLYNPGVHWMKDVRSGVYNFATGLERVPRIEDYEESGEGFVPSSGDGRLLQEAKERGSKIIGSTSSVSGILCQIYFWLSKRKKPNFGMLSREWENKAQTFSYGQSIPAVSTLRALGDGMYAVDAGKDLTFEDERTDKILSELGIMLERYLTTERGPFGAYLKSEKKRVAKKEESEGSHYHYMQYKRMFLRSQIDSWSPYLPKKVFDVKTRATVALRHDRMNYEEAQGYKIRRETGYLESFEREYYDLIRSAFLKYQFQARIGNMDGCFVAYHGMSRMFGFQYVPVEEMDRALFGSHIEGNLVFQHVIGFLEMLLLRALECFPGKTVNMVTMAHNDRLYLFVTHGKELKVIEVDGVNIVNGEVVGQVDIAAAAEDKKRRTAMGKDAVPEWEVHYNIRVVDGKDEDMEGLYETAVDKVQSLNYVLLPSGMTQEEVRRVQEGESHGDELARRFPNIEGLSYVSEPSGLVQVLRELSRRGAREVVETAPRAIVVSDVRSVSKKKNRRRGKKGGPK